MCRKLRLYKNIDIFISLTTWLQFHEQWNGEIWGDDGKRKSKRTDNGGIYKNKMKMS